MRIDCDPSNFIRSPRGLPYPKLDVFIQSCLDTYDMLQLCDVIDGTNVSEEWGENNLDLEGTNDVEWAKEKNKRERSLAESGPILCLPGKDGETNGRCGSCWCAPRRTGWTGQNPRMSL